MSLGSEVPPAMRSLFRLLCGRSRALIATSDQTRRRKVHRERLGWKTMLCRCKWRPQKAPRSNLSVVFLRSSGNRNGARGRRRGATTTMPRTIWTGLLAALLFGGGPIFGQQAPSELNQIQSRIREFGGALQSTPQSETRSQLQRANAAEF